MKAGVDIVGLGMPQTDVVSFNTDSGQNTVHVMRGNRVHRHSYMSVISIPPLSCKSGLRSKSQLKFFLPLTEQAECAPCLSTQQKTPLWMWGHMEVVYSSVWPKSVAPTPEAPSSLILLLRKGFHITIILIACCHRNTPCCVVLHFSWFPPLQHSSTSPCVSSLPE